jgi:hypothetical protein
LKFEAAFATRAAPLSALFNNDTAADEKPFKLDPKSFPKVNRPTASPIDDFFSAKVGVRALVKKCVWFFANVSQAQKQLETGFP